MNFVWNKKNNLFLFIWFHLYIFSGRKESNCYVFQQLFHDDCFFFNVNCVWCHNTIQLKCNIKGLYLGSYLFKLVARSIQYSFMKQKKNNLFLFIWFHLYIFSGRKESNCYVFQQLFYDDCFFFMFIVCNAITQSNCNAI